MPMITTGYYFNTSDAKATFVQSTRMQTVGREVKKYSDLLASTIIHTLIIFLNIKIMIF